MWRGGVVAWWRGGFAWWRGVVAWRGGVVVWGSDAGEEEWKTEENGEE